MATQAIIVNLLQLIVVSAAGVYFGYKFLTGWMSANMDIAIESSRVHANDQEDYLAIIVKLERGEYGPLKLGDAQIRITYLDSTAEPPPLLNLAGTARLASSEGKLDWKKVASDSPHLSLHAKEKSEFAAARRVPRRAACIIEVTLSTHRRLDNLIRLDFRGRRWGQRRSSSVSLPLSDDAMS